MNPQTLTRAFQTRFGRPPTAIARAPGRVNLIGEHVDYCQGLVLPIAIDRATYAASAPGADNLIRIHSASVDETTEFKLHDFQPPRGVSWTAYAMGVAAGLIAADINIPATNIYIDSDLPIGAGLASSAALEIAVALSLLHAARASLDDRKLAALCRKAEHDYARMPCGIMDQLACRMARADHAMLIDCRNADIDYIPWPNEDATILIADSGQTHQLSESPYATRVDECRRALEHIQRAFPKTESLRDTTPQQLAATQPDMPPELFHRARHVITEIARTRQAAHAIAAGDLLTLGRLMNESHDSLAIDYQVSTPHLDELASALRSASGVLGARMTGGGFGGAVIALMHSEKKGTERKKGTGSEERGASREKKGTGSDEGGACPLFFASSFAAIETHLQSWYDTHQITAAPLIATTPAPGASLTADPAPWTSKSTT